MKPSSKNDTKLTPGLTRAKIEEAMAQLRERTNKKVEEIIQKMVDNDLKRGVDPEEIKDASKMLDKEIEIKVVVELRKGGNKKHHGGSECGFVCNIVTRHLDLRRGARRRAA